MRNWILVAAAVAGACSDSGSVSGPADAKSFLAVPQAMRIEAVDVRVAESSPPLVVARVRGVVPDSCSRRVSIEQRPHSTGVTVMIWVLRPPVGTPASLCPPVDERYEQDIPLAGSFSSGTYTVSVNGFQRTVEL